MRTLGILSLVLSFCLGGAGAALRVSLPPSFGAVPIVLSAAWNLFAEEGVEVEMVPLPAQRDRLLAFQAGQIDAFVTDLTGALLLVSSMPTEAVIAGSVFSAQGPRAHVALITPPGYSRISTWEELAARVRKGDRVQIAVPRQSDLEFALDELFFKSGLTFRPEGYIGQDNMLTNASWTLFGMVTAAALPQPYVDYILNYDFPGKPALVVLAEIDSQDVPPDVIVFRRTALNRNGAAAAAFFRAIRRAAVRLNEMERDELVATGLPVAVQLFFPGAGPDPAKPEEWARVEAAIAAIVLPRFPEPAPVDPTMFDRVVSWARRKGYLRAALSYAQVTTPPPG